MSNLISVKVKVAFLDFLKRHDLERVFQIATSKPVHKDFVEREQKQRARTVIRKTIERETGETFRTGSFLRDIVKRGYILLNRTVDVPDIEERAKVFASFIRQYVVEELPPMFSKIVDGVPMGKRIVVKRRKVTIEAWNTRKIDKKRVKGTKTVGYWVMENGSPVPVFNPERIAKKDEKAICERVTYWKKFEPVKVETQATTFDKVEEFFPLRGLSVNSCKYLQSIAKGKKGEYKLKGKQRGETKPLIRYILSLFQVYGEDISETQAKFFRTEKGNVMRPNSAQGRHVSKFGIGDILSQVYMTLWENVVMSETIPTPETLFEQAKALSSVWFRALWYEERRENAKYISVDMLAENELL